MGRKRTSNTRKLHLGSGTGRTLPNNPSRIQDRSEQHKNQRPNPVIYRILILFTEKKHLPQPRRFLLGETFRRETPEEFWRRLIEIEKECNFNTISAEELLISNYMTAITNKKLRDKIMNGKTLELAKKIELIKQNTYEKKNKKNEIPEALISKKEQDENASSRRYI